MKIMSYQIPLPKGVRDRMSIEDEQIILGLIDFAWDRGYQNGYGEGYDDAVYDHNQSGECNV